MTSHLAMRRLSVLFGIGLSILAIGVSSIKAQDGQSASQVAANHQIVIPPPPTDNLEQNFPNESPTPPSTGSRQADLQNLRNTKESFIEKLKEYRITHLTEFNDDLIVFSEKLSEMSETIEKMRAALKLSPTEYQCLFAEHQRLFSMTRSSAPLLRSYKKWDRLSKTRLASALRQRDTIVLQMREF